MRLRPTVGTRPLRLALRQLLTRPLTLTLTLTLRGTYLLLFFLLGRIRFLILRCHRHQRTFYGLVDARLQPARNLLCSSRVRFLPNTISRLFPALQLSTLLAGDWLGLGPTRLLRTLLGLHCIAVAG